MSGDLQGFKALLAWAGFNWFNLAAVTVAIVLKLAAESRGIGNDNACHYCLALYALSWYNFSLLTFCKNLAHEYKCYIAVIRGLH